MAWVDLHGEIEDVFSALVVPEITVRDDAREVRMVGFHRVGGSLSIIRAVRQSSEESYLKRLERKRARRRAIKLDAVRWAKEREARERENERRRARKAAA